MKEMNATTNERIFNLLEEVLVKISYLLSELSDGTDDVPNKSELVKNKISIADGKNAKNESVGDDEKKEYILNYGDDEEEIKFCDEHSYVSCSIEI